MSDKTPSTKCKLTGYTESKHADWEDDVQRFHGQGSPSIAHAKSDRPPTPQPAVHVEVNDSLIPIAGEFGPRIQQRNAIPPDDNDSHLLPSNVGTCPSQPGSCERDSMQQPNERVRPPLLTEPEFLYGCKAFKFLM